MTLTPSETSLLAKIVDYYALQLRMGMKVDYKKEILLDIHVIRAKLGLLSTLSPYEYDPLPENLTWK